MKKIFTLIAAAFMAIGAYAQNGVLSFTEQQTIAGGSTLNAGELSVTFGAENDSHNNTWQMKTSNNDFHDTYPVSVQGSQNPTDNESTKYTESKKNLPTSGGFFKMKSDKTGIVTVYIKSGASKPLYVTDSEGTALATSDLILKDKDGNSAEWATNTKGERIATNAAFSGTLSFTAEPNKEYYLFAVGSKLTVFAFTFAESTTAISSVAAEAANGNTIYNLSGQQVDENYKGIAIVNGKKVVK